MREKSIYLTEEQIKRVLFDDLVTTGQLKNMRHNVSVTFEYQKSPDGTQALSGATVRAIEVPPLQRAGSWVREALKKAA